jgi:hypothetical protein
MTLCVVQSFCVLVLLAAAIDALNAKFAGNLYVWVYALMDGKPTAQPRAYRLPYPKDLHAPLNEGMKKVRQGISQVGTAEPKAGQRGLAWLRPGNDEQVVRIGEMPVSELPEE